MVFIYYFYEVLLFIKSKIIQAKKKSFIHIIIVPIELILIINNLIFTKKIIIAIIIKLYNKIKFKLNII